MALSNIFREPRREITESAVGLAITGTYLYLLWRFAVWFARWAAAKDYLEPRAGDYVLGLGIGAGCTFLAFLLLLAAHEIGEGVCNGLAQRGIELRPPETLMEGFAVGALVEVIRDCPEMPPQIRPVIWREELEIRPGDQGVVVSGTYRCRPPPYSWADAQDVLFGSKIRGVAVPLLREILPPPPEEIEEEDDVTV